jgi:hypothetical protein
MDKNLTKTIELRRVKQDYNAVLMIAETSIKHIVSHETAVSEPLLRF